MADDIRQLVIDTASLIAEAAGTQTIAIDVAELSGVSDYMIVTTVQSYAQLQGLMSRLDQSLTEAGIQPRNPTKRPKDDMWAYIDCGNFIIHIMRPEARSFYELEKLWREGTVLFQQ